MRNSAYCSSPAPSRSSLLPSLFACLCPTCHPLSEYMVNFYGRYLIQGMSLKWPILKNFNEKKVMTLMAMANKCKIWNTDGIFRIRPFAMVSFGLETFAMTNRNYSINLRTYDVMNRLILYATRLIVMCKRL